MHHKTGADEDADDANKSNIAGLQGSRVQGVLAVM